MGRADFDHVGIVTPDPTPLIAHAAAFGADVTGPYPALGVDVDLTFARFANGAGLEVIVPTSAAGWSAVGVEPGRTALHHVALGVSDVDAACTLARSLGLEPTAPRAAVLGSRQTFIDSGGIRTELIAWPSSSHDEAGHGGIAQ